MRERINSGKDKMNLCKQDLDRVREKQREKKLQQESISKGLKNIIFVSNFQTVIKTHVDSNNGLKKYMYM